MAVTVTNNLTTWNAAENTTGWVSDGGGLTAYTGFQREGTNALGEQASSGAVNVYYATTAVNMSAGYTIFGPWLRSGNPTLQSTGGFRIVVGDGTDRAAYYVGGSDNYGFFFGGYSLFKLDLNQKASYSNTTLAGGGDGALTLTNISQIGGGWNYGSKAVGSSDNVFLDIVRYIANGTPALVVGGGGSGTEGTFDEIVALDESTTNAWGVLRRVAQGTKAYELNFGIDFGNSGTASSYFQDSDFQLFINGTNMTAGNMDVVLLANGTGTNLFSLSDFVVVGVGTLSNWDLSNTNSNTMQIFRGNFSDLGTITFPATGGTSRYCTDSSFNGCGAITFGSGLDARRNIFSSCGQITHGGADMRQCDISSYEGAADSASLVYNIASDPDGEMDQMSFTKGTAATHAIEFGTSSPLTMTLRDIDFVGYNATNGQNDSTFLVQRTTGTVTINIIGGSGNVSYKSAGATVDIVQNPVTLTIKVIDIVSGLPISGARVLVLVADGLNYPYQDVVTAVINSGVITVSNIGHGLGTGDRVLISGIDGLFYTTANGIFTIEVIDQDTYSYDSNLLTPPTDVTLGGTITSTLVIIEGTTDVNGLIDATRSYSFDQDITGKVRRATTGELYKNSPITGTINKDTGLDLTIQMVRDDL